MEKGEVKAPSLSDFLREREYIPDEEVVSVLEKKLQSKRKAFLLRGEAGTGKTLLTQLVSEYLNAQYIFYQCTAGTSEDDLLYKYVPSEKSKSGIKVTLGAIPLALKLSQRKKVVLAIDEFDKTRPSADALLLDVLQNFRVSLYLDEQKTVIQGNPDNLVIFLTSNDFREFSEPLIRRVTVITLKHLPPNHIYELLRKQFSDELSRLLTQIYIDTINANLRKPATIQELIELGEVISKGDGIDLLKLIKMFVIKYDDDLEKYLQYIQTRKATYDFIKSNREKEKNSNIEEHYIPNKINDFEEKKKEDPEPQTKKVSISDLLNVLKPNTDIEPLVTIPATTDESRTEIVSMRADNNDMEMYDKIVKVIKPKPSDNPAILGKFEVWKADNNMFIISKEPLSFDEFRKLHYTEGIFEIYSEDKIRVLTSQINNMNKDSGIKVITYSRRVLRYQEKKSASGEVLTEIQLDSDYDPEIPKAFNAVIRIYEKRDQKTLSSRIVDVLTDYNRYMLEYLGNGILVTKDPDEIINAIKVRTLYEREAYNVIKILVDNPELRKSIKIKLDWAGNYRIYHDSYRDYIVIEVKKDELDMYKKIFGVEGG